MPGRWMWLVTELQTILRTYEKSRYTCKRNTAFQAGFQSLMSNRRIFLFVPTAEPMQRQY